MLFNSLDFVQFFAIVFVFALFLRASNLGRKLLLLLASYVFYMAWSPPFVLLLMFSTALDYMAGRRISAGEQPTARTGWLVASCLGNLGVLAFFKYGEFVVGNLWAFAPASYAAPSFFESIVLPVGISFYTFQSMSYTIDVYRDERACERNLLDFALYVSFFPQLVAGPILRSTEFLPQLKTNRVADAGDVLAGIDQAARGFAKKVLVADTLGAYVNIVYASPAEFGAANHLLAVYAFAFQIYFDFSGYSDIAIGTARILGYRVPENFRLPYLARNPSDFWRRWHISLSSWLRDYLYISLGGNRSARWKTYRNLLLTMVLGGLWHGAAWGFVIWGLFHGVWLALHRALFRSRSDLRIPAYLSVFCTFHLACIGWVFFRAESLETAIDVFGRFVAFDTPYYSPTIYVYFMLAVGFLSHLFGASTHLQKWWEGMFVGVKGLWYAIIALGIYLYAGEASEFIYFQF